MKLTQHEVAKCEEALYEVISSVLSDFGLEASDDHNLITTSYEDEDGNEIFCSFSTSLDQG